MSRLATIAVLVACAMPIAAQPATDKAALLDAATKAARTGGSASCFAGGGAMNMTVTNRGFYVAVEGPVGRVASAMNEAKKMYKPFTVEQITDEMAAPSITVTAVPDKPFFGPTHLSFTQYDDGSPAWHLAPLAKHIVLKTRPKKGQAVAVLQPSDVSEVPVSWSNAMGGSFSGQGVVARFELDALRAFTVDDIDVAIVSDIDDERACKVGKNDLAKVK